MPDCDSESCGFESCCLPMLQIYIKDKTVQWAQRRYKIINPYYVYILKRIVRFSIFFFKKKRIKKYWDYYNPINLYFLLYDFSKYKNLYTTCNSKTFIYKYIYTLHGIYNKNWVYLETRKKFYKNTKKKKFAALKFIFGPQQIFFQLFIKNSYAPSTHTTVGAIIRIRENLATHGSYKQIINQTTEERKLEKLRTKKNLLWHKEKYNSDSFLDICGYKKIIEVPKINEENSKKIKTKNINKLKKRRKKYKDLDDNVILNKRGNIKTEPLLNKCLRRRSSTWFWFFRTIFQYLSNRKILIKQQVILIICGFKKMYGMSINYLIKLFIKYKIVLFLFKLNLFYKSTKIKHYSTLRKKTRKRLLKTENLKFF